MRSKRSHRLKTSSKKWFRDWWKQDHLHKIKTKSLSIIRFEVDHQRAMIEWFSKYKTVLKALNIRKRRNILNFDEIDFRTKCLKSQKIIVSIKIKKHYQISFDNRKSMIIIKIINAVDDYFFSFIIMRTLDSRYLFLSELLSSWFSQKERRRTRILIINNCSSSKNFLQSIIFSFIFI
jgi:hypothetical protein